MLPGKSEEPSQGPELLFLGEALLPSPPAPQSLYCVPSFWDSSQKDDQRFIRTNSVGNSRGWLCLSPGPSVILGRRLPGPGSLRKLGRRRAISLSCLSPPGHPHLGHLCLLHPVPCGLPDIIVGNCQALWLQDPVD